MVQYRPYGVAAVVMACCFFLSCTVFVYWWIIAGQGLNVLLPPGTMGPLDPFIALGSIQMAGNLNMSNMGFALVYVALLLLIMIADGLLCNLINRVQQNSKLPALSVLGHYQSSPDPSSVVFNAGTARSWKKVVRRQN